MAKVSRNKNEVTSRFADQYDLNEDMLAEISQLPPTKAEADAYIKETGIDPRLNQQNRVEFYANKLKEAKTQALGFDANIPDVVAFPKGDVRAKKLRLFAPTLEEEQKQREFDAQLDQRAQQALQEEKAFDAQLEVRAARALQEERQAAADAEFEASALSAIPGSGLVRSVKDAVTGGVRNTELSESFDERIEDAPELQELWAEDPAARVAINPVIGSTAGPEELLKIAAKRGVSVQRDEMGNPYFVSKNGKVYGSKPGLTVEDIKTTAADVAGGIAKSVGGAAIGAKTGAAIGTAVAPGMGSAAGAVVGGISGFIGSAVAQGATAYAAEKKQEEVGGDFNTLNVVVPMATEAVGPLVRGAQNIAKQKAIQKELADLGIQGGPAISPTASAMVATQEYAAGGQALRNLATRPETLVRSADQPLRVGTERTAEALTRDVLAAAPSAGPAAALKAEAVQAAQRASVDQSALTPGTAMANRAVANADVPTSGSALSEVINSNRSAVAGAVDAKASQIAGNASVNPEVLASAKRAGIDVPTDVASSSAAVRELAAAERAAGRLAPLDEVGSALKARLGSVFGNASEDAASSIFKRAIKSDARDVVDSLSRLEKVVPGSSILELPSTRSLLNERLSSNIPLSAEESGLVRLLKSQDRNGVVGNRNVTLSDVLAKARELEGKVASTSTTQNLELLERLANALRADADSFVTAIGGKSLVEEVVETEAAVAGRKALIDRKVFGQSDELSDKVIALFAGTGGSKAEASALANAINDLTEQEASDAVGAVLRKMFTNADGDVDLNLFVKGYDNLRKTEKSPLYAAIAKSLGKESMDLLRAVYSVSKAVGETVKFRFPEGKILGEAKILGLVQAVINKNYGEAAQIGKRIAVEKGADKAISMTIGGLTGAIGGAPGAVVGAVAGGLVGDKLKTMLISSVSNAIDGKKNKAIADFFTNKQFQELAAKVAKSAEPDKSLSFLQKDISNLTMKVFAQEDWKKYLAALPKEKRRTAQSDFVTTVQNIVASRTIKNVYEAIQPEMALEDTSEERPLP